MGATEIQRGRNYVHPGNRPGVYTEPMDSANLIMRETNLHFIPQQHIDPDKLPNVAPTKQISDALTAEELNALERHVLAYFVSISKYKTTSMEDNPRAGDVVEYLKDKDLRTLAMFDHVQTKLTWSHGAFMSFFINMVAEDVGTKSEKRKKNNDKMYQAGYEIIRRKNKNVAQGGFTGYLRAVSQSILELQHEFHQILQTKRLQISRQEQQLIKALGRR